MIVYLLTNILILTIKDFRDTEFQIGSYCENVYDRFVKILNLRRTISRYLICNNKYRTVRSGSIATFLRIHNHLFLAQLSSKTYVTYSYVSLNGSKNFNDCCDKSVQQCCMSLIERFLFSGFFWPSRRRKFFGKYDNVRFTYV